MPEHPITAAAPAAAPVLAPVSAGKRVDVAGVYEPGVARLAKLQALRTEPVLGVRAYPAVRAGGRRQRATASGWR